MAQGAGIETLGREVVQALYAALQALRLYPFDNATVQHSLSNVQDVVSGALKTEGSLELRLAGEFFFLNEARLRFDLSNYATIGMVRRTVDRHGIGVIEIQSGVVRDEWAPFLLILLSDGPSENAFAGFVDRLAQAAVEHIEVRSAGDVATTDAEVDQQKGMAKRSYVQSVGVAKEVLTDFRLGRAVNVRKVKRAIQNIVDQVLTNEASIIEMTTLREFDEYTFTHSVNVCIFSVVIGQRLGLDKRQLYELGLGALFHDIGKMRVDPAVLNKPGKLDPEEWEEMKRHPTLGLLSFFEMQGFAELPYRQMLQAYEHHMQIDLVGFPKCRRPRQPTLFTHIVAVADAFDAATSIRSYRYAARPPDKVLQAMRDDPDWGKHHLIVKVFINLTGVYPVGTLVLLDTSELAVVTARNPDSDLLHRPFVKVISDSSGAAIAEPYTVDLSEMDAVTNAPKRTVMKTLDAQKYGMNVGEYFV